MAGPVASEDTEGPLAGEHKLLASAKKLSLFAAGAASQKYMQALAEQQEIMGALADCISEVYALESCILRTEKLMQSRGEAGAAQAIAMTQYYAAKAIDTVERSDSKGDRRGGRGRYAAHPDGDPAPAGEARAGEYDCTGSPDRETRARRGEVLVVEVKGTDSLTVAAR